MTAQTQNNPSKNNRVIAILCGALVVGMVGMAYAAVPLYALFCQVTGYAGTTQRADAPTGNVGIREVNVRFDSNVNSELAWEFKPLQREVTLKLGEQRLAFYQAKNISKETVVGTAVFNVTPMAAGAYFNKVECFCFTEQALEPGQSIEMPVSFFIDPDIEKDEDLAKLKTITLSYTFYPVKKDKKAKSAKSARVEISKGAVN